MRMLHEMRASPALGVLVASVVVPSMAMAAGRVAIERTSVGSGGSELAASYDGAVSSDGRFVVFDSDATNLVTGDTNGASDVFLVGVR